MKYIRRKLKTVVISFEFVSKFWSNLGKKIWGTHRGNLFAYVFKLGSVRCIKGNMLQKTDFLILLKDIQSKKLIKWVAKNPLVLVYGVNGMWQKMDFLMLLKDIQRKKLIDWVAKNPLVLVYEMNDMWQKTDFLMFLKDTQSKKSIKWFEKSFDFVLDKKSFDFVLDKMG